MIHIPLSSRKQHIYYKMNYNIFLVLLYIYCSISCLKAESTRFNTCSDTDPKGLCEIYDVNIYPCKEAAANKPCVFKRGNSAGIQLNFNVLKSSETIKAQAYGVLIAEVPFDDMDTNGCKYTTCPFVAGNNQTLTFDLMVKKIYPRGKFNVKFKLWNENKEGCCAGFNLKLM